MITLHKPVLSSDHIICIIAALKSCRLGPQPHCARSVQTGQKDYPYTRGNVTSIKQHSSCRPMWEDKENDRLCHINNDLSILGTLGSWLISNVFINSNERVQYWKHLEQSMRQLCWCMWGWSLWGKAWRIPAPVFWLFSQ